MDKAELIRLMALEDKIALEALYAQAYAIKEKYVGKKAYYRGLIELSNLCVKDCAYCGIRRGAKIERYTMTKEEILQMALWAHENQYGSVTLQSGERQDDAFVEFIAAVIQEIKEVSQGQLGITLSLGEQKLETYQKWFDCGAHRYLLRIETTNPRLYKKIHPGNHSFKNRLACLDALRQAGYQVGTGVMIGLPGQTTEDLVNDILFFEAQNVAMIGMGPYVVHGETPLGIEAVNAGLDTVEARQKRVELTLKMIALCRLYLKDVNIAATTAMQALHPLGRELCLKAGANILMPIITLPAYKQKYQLYDNKPGIEDDPVHIKNGLTAQVHRAGDEVGFGQWGDSPRFLKNVKNTL